MVKLIARRGQPRQRKVERVQDPGLAVGKEGHAHEEIRIPQREVAMAHDVGGVIPVGIKIKERVAARKDEIGERELPEKRAANCQQSKVRHTTGQRWGDL
jgi:hypothetical protein